MYLFKLLLFKLLMKIEIVILQYMIMNMTSVIFNFSIYLNVLLYYTYIYVIVTAIFPSIICNLN